MKTKPVRLEAKIKELKDDIWSNSLIFLVILIVLFPYDFKFSSILWFMLVFLISVFGTVFQIVKLNKLKNWWK